MAEVREGPIPNSFWVDPGRLLAGEYPGHVRAEEARDKVQRFIDAGVNCFVDLTEEGELNPYADYLTMETAEEAGAEYYRMPIRDISIPTPEHMTRILDLIDERLAADRVVYVHCWGGVGRTGTVAGCWLVRHGMTADDALSEIARLRAPTPKAGRVAPETGEQVRMVRGWRQGQ